MNHPCTSTSCLISTWSSHGPQHAAPAVLQRGPRRGPQFCGVQATPGDVHIPYTTHVRGARPASWAPGPAQACGPVHVRTWLHAWHGMLEPSECCRPAVACSSLCTHEVQGRWHPLASGGTNDQPVAEHLEHYMSFGANCIGTMSCLNACSAEATWYSLLARVLQQQLLGGPPLAVWHPHRGISSCHTTCPPANARQRMTCWQLSPAQAPGAAMHLNSACAVMAISASSVPSDDSGSCARHQCMQPPVPQRALLQSECPPVQHAHSQTNACLCGVPPSPAAARAACRMGDDLTICRTRPPE